MPLGIYEGLPININGVVIPADVAVINTDAYALIVGNEWLTKVKACINWETMTVGLNWAGSKVTVPVQCWTRTIEAPQEEEDSDTDSSNDESEDSDDEAN